MQMQDADADADADTGTDTDTDADAATGTDANACTPGPHILSHVRSSLMYVPRHTIPTNNAPLTYSMATFSINAT